MKASQQQIDGKHYKTMGIQPVGLVYKVGGSPAFLNVSKYLTRKKAHVPRNVDIKKALHFVQLEEEFICDSNYGYGCVLPTGVNETEKLDHAATAIELFSSQFPKDSKEINQALLALYVRDYSLAKESIQLILDKVMTP